ncbi:PREDICTED: uncharacterized protein LOC108575525 [Habropoda laboriosa]|uniref:uncharacterized protein LOC108575525 n=1 Tax=Habropoda laboriosa TaxID=597456 RepID=UPI00083E46FF|nr:PREDICTED: uncharacterized protein LOC108575525 [Habropoda laboriosa]
MNRLGALMGNMKGPTQAKRRLLAAVGQANFLYGAPIWAEKVQKGANRVMADRSTRMCALRVVAAYKTISTEAVAVIAGVPPMHLLAEIRQRNYKKMRALIEQGMDPKIKNKIRRQIKKDGEKELVDRWQKGRRKRPGKPCGQKK